MGLIFFCTGLIIKKRKYQRRGNMVLQGIRNIKKRKYQEKETCRSYLIRKVNKKQRNRLSKLSFPKSTRIWSSQHLYIEDNLEAKRSSK